MFIVGPQIVPLSVATKNLPDRAGSISDGELVFLSTVQPVGFNTYFVQKSTGASRVSTAG